MLQVTGVRASDPNFRSAQRLCVRETEFVAMSVVMQVGGREVVYKGNLTLVVVRGAGHEVPLLRSAQWLQVFESFLKGSLLPSNPYN